MNFKLFKMIMNLEKNARKHSSGTFFSSCRVCFPLFLGKPDAFDGLSNMSLVFQYKALLIRL